jgi:hypothetical protein
VRQAAPRRGVRAKETYKKYIYKALKKLNGKRNEKKIQFNNNIGVVVKKYFFCSVFSLTLSAALLSLKKHTYILFSY